MGRKRKSEFSTEGTNKKKTINADNAGWKLLEKMGWQHGHGLGKDNQGMTENPQWKHLRDVNCKLGFKSKEEFTKEVLVHQNAFEDLLGELNAQGSEDNVESVIPSESTSQDPVPVFKRQTRYTKTARAKDINNYSIKDFEGIIGKDVTKKNLSSLLEDKKESKTKVVTRNQAIRNGKKSKVSQSSVQRFKHKIDAFDETETTAKSHPYINDVDDCNSPVSDSKKKIKRKNLLGNCSSENDISTRCIQNSDTSFEAKHSKLGKVESNVRKTKRNKEENLETHFYATDLCASLRSTTRKKNIRIASSSKDIHCGKNEINERLLQKPSEIHNIYTSDHHYFLQIPDVKTKDRNLSIKSKRTKPEKEFCRKDNILTDHFEKEKPKRNTKQGKSKNNKEVNVSNSTLRWGMNTECSNSSSNSRNMQSIAEIRRNKGKSTKGNGQDLCEELAQDDVLNKISLGFIGSNLNTIKGYGNW